MLRSPVRSWPGAPTFCPFAIFLRDLSCENGERLIEFDAIMCLNPKIVKSLRCFGVVLHVYQARYVRPRRTRDTSHAHYKCTSVQSIRYLKNE
ncbi:hypothetical protein J3E68DRAFT_387945 [Trichoderma sp. SZMC 28012]